MSGFTKIVEGDVEIIHHSGASVIELKLSIEEPREGGGSDKRVETITMEYSTFSDLKKASNKTDDWL